MKRTALLFFILLLILNACHTPSPKNETASFFSYTDYYGRTISLDSVPQRVISLSPALTEMTFLLGAEDKLVGISDYCHFPAATDTMKRVGGLLNVNVEMLLSLNPDAVLIGSIVSKQDVENMERAGLKVLVVREETRLQGLCNALLLLGHFFDKNEEAEKQVQALQQQLDDISQNIDTSIVNKKVYYVVGFGEQGDFTAPASSHIHEIITAAGGKNIGENLKTWEISREFLFQSDPDIIIIRKEDAERFVRTSPYNQLRAVREKHVYAIESGWIDNVSPRNVEAVQYINQLLK